jgi:hypothetical protein
MRAETKEADRGESAPLDRVRPQPSPTSSRAVNRDKGAPASAGAGKKSRNARAEAPELRLPAERRIVEVPPPPRGAETPEQDHARADEPRRNMLRRHSPALLIASSFLL